MDQEQQTPPNRWGLTGCAAS